MKLYATTSSERASKGQGGNKHLRVDILVETDKGRETVGSVELRVESETIHLISTVPQYKVFIKSKGEQKKDEECLHRDDGGANPHCLKCGKAL